jgi:uncharacterized protein (TIGR02246 family)
MKHLLILLCVAFFSLAFLPACAPPPEPPTVESPSVEADIEALKTAAADWDAAWNSQDLEKLLSLYTEDAVRMPPNEAAEVGKEAIRGSLQRSFGEFTSQGGSVVDDVRVSGDLAYVRGTGEYTDTPKTGGEPIQGVGKWVAVHQRQPDGSWKMICEIWNSNLPLSDEEASGTT